jgi:poly-gamma-glutamate synthesis protein (capsule biosynthesis protein)
MQSIGTRQGLIAKHVFYNNRYIGTQFIPTIIEDYCQPRLMNLEEKANFLEIIYNSSINITKTDGDNANT